MHLLHRLQCGMLLIAAAACANAGGGADPRQPTPTPPVVGGTQLTTHTALYPRVIRLAHAGAANGRLLLSYVTFPGGAYGEGDILASDDDGRTWSSGPIGFIVDSSAHGLCCATLYEVPTASGGLAAGTLLWAASVGQQETGRRMALRVWKSVNGGRDWTFLSSCANASNEGGLWEPELAVAADGRLVCYYSDETLQPTYSQVIARVESTDGGATWGPRLLTVASANPAHRPGMPVVRRMPDGSYVMTYEICGVPDANCATYIRRSPDGLVWGDSSALGARIVSTAGHYFAHAPVVAVRPGGTGGLVLVGQLLENAAQQQVTGSGGTLMVTSGDGSGDWVEVRAPLQVSSVYDNYCPNYSTSLLPSVDGSGVLMIATAWVGPVCAAFQGTGSLGP